MHSGGDAATANETLVRESKTLKLKLEEAKKSEPCLVIYLGKPQGKRFLLTSKPQAIGRGSECEISILDGSLSRKHAQIFRKGEGQLCIKDLGSTNGTFINDQRLSRGKATGLKDGDFVRLGNIILKFVAKGKIDNVFHKDILALATQDDLTGVPNRKSILAALEEGFLKARKTNQPLSLIILDLDKFKSVNDDFGHAAGDLVLKDAAKVITNIVRDQDFVGRYGGDEFLILLSNTSRANACIIAERIRAGVEKHLFVYEDKKIIVTLSLGVACLDDSLQSTDDLVKKADDAQYTAKKNGGNQVSSR